MAFTDNLEKDYIDFRKKVMTDAAFREAEIQKCISGFSKVPGSIERFSIIMDFPKEKVATTACRRFEKAWMQGKVTAYIYINWRKGFTTPEAIRILQGRN